MSFNREAFIGEVVRLHNVYRSAHGAPALQRDATLEQKAQAYANRLTHIGSLTHENDKSCGENLYWAGTYDYPTAKALAEQCMNGFYNEKQLYTYNPNIINTGSMHFTQVVWKATRRIGVGVAITSGNPYNYSIYICVKYDPPGNVWTVDAFRQNVTPPQR